MSYREFTVKEVSRRFGLAIDESHDLFVDAPEVAASPRLQSILDESLPLAFAINTEKARSELIIAPVLLEVRSRLQHRVSLFSGVEFSVAPEQGLNGTCDFLLARSPEQLFIDAPVVAIAEARNEDLKGGVGHCMAEMVAARIFNEREGKPARVIYGAVTTGIIWRFLKLDGQGVGLDRRDYHIVERLPKILGILVGMLAEDGEAVSQSEGI